MRTVLKVRAMALVSGKGRRGFVRYQRPALNGFGVLNIRSPGNLPGVGIGPRLHDLQIPEVLPLVPKVYR